MEAERGLRFCHLNDQLFSKIASKMGAKLKSWNSVDMDSGTSNPVLSNRSVANNNQDAIIVGNLAFDLHLLPYCENDDTNISTRKVILRTKAPGAKSISARVQAISKLSLEEAEEATSALQYWSNSELRDVLVQQTAMDDSVLQTIMPTVLYVELNRENNVSFFVMDRFDSTMCSHIDCIEGGEGFDKHVWGQHDIQCVLKGIATFHAKFLGRLELLPSNLMEYLQDGVDIFHNSARYMKIGSTNNSKFYPDICSSLAAKIVHRVAETIDVIVEEFNACPKTLIHNDCNPRNSCLRLGQDSGNRSLCLYDWELAAIHVPHVDLAEFLLFSLPVKGALESMLSLAEFYRQCLIEELDKLGNPDKSVYRVADPIIFRKLFDYSVMERLSARLMLYCSVARAVGINMPFLGRCINVAAEYLRCVAKEHTFLQVQANLIII